MIKPIGILGGMGPEASLLMAQYIFESQVVECDQEHIPFILYSENRIPDRSLFLTGKSSEDPFPMMQKIVTKLSAISSAILITCNTAHFWYDKLQKINSTVPIFHMIDSTAKVIQSETDKVLIISTEGTKEQKIYDESFEKYGISIEYPQDMVSVQSAINCIKQKDYHQAQQLIATILKEYPSHIIVFGCTEFSVLQLQTSIFSQRLHYDPMKIVAQEAVNFYHKLIEESH